MTHKVERYDRIAAGYEQWWAPVLMPSAVVLLDLLENVVAAGGRDIIDLGVGTGNLSLAGLRRWPTVRITGIDASCEMITAVEALVEDRMPAARDRFHTRVAFAAELPFEDGSFDGVMSSFVLQLVPNRTLVLREVRRVLRPGGAFTWVTWLKDERVFAPDRVFDTLLSEFGFENEDDPNRSGDIPSVERAAAEMRRARFRNVAATPATLEYAFTVDRYISFLTEFDEETLFAEMRREERRRFLARFRERLMALDPDELTFRVPIVYVEGVRPPG